MYKGRLFVISGPSGAGKGTICRMLLKEVDAALSISFTTREPRQGEVDGVSYRFISTAEFEKMIEDGGFLEYAKVYENYYGTPKSQVLEKLNEGVDVILEIDVQGAAQIRKMHPEGIFIYILPPSMAELMGRIKKRGTETEEAMKLRMSKAVSEISRIVDYDYYVINKDIAETVENAKSIIAVQRFKVSGDTHKLIKKYEEEIDALSIYK